ncbi:MAG: uracil phosphoribosyltransferase [bacterium]
MPVKVIEHPIVKDKLSRLRDKNTSSSEFRRYLHQLSLFLFYEASRNIVHTESFDIETPLGKTCGERIKYSNLAFVPILRAGLGMLEPLLELVPDSSVYHIGIYRNEQTLEPVLYYSNIDKTIFGKEVFILDPMIATAGSIIKSFKLIEEFGPGSVKALCAIIAPEGLELIEKETSSFEIFAASIDEKLTSTGFIYPGLGDAGNRYFGNT